MLNQITVYFDAESAVWWFHPVDYLGNQIDDGEHHAQKATAIHFAQKYREDYAKEFGDEYLAAKVVVYTRKFKMMKKTY